MKIKYNIRAAAMLLSYILRNNYIKVTIFFNIYYHKSLRDPGKSAAAPTSEVRASAMLLFLIKRSQKL